MHFCTQVYRALQMHPLSPVRREGVGRNLKREPRDPERPVVRQSSSMNPEVPERFKSAGEIRLIFKKMTSAAFEIRRKRFLN